MAANPRGFLLPDKPGQVVLVFCVPSARNKSPIKLLKLKLYPFAEIYLPAGRWVRAVRTAADSSKKIRTYSLANIAENRIVAVVRP
jgi:hypothetical protein